MEFHSRGIFHVSNHLLDIFDASQRHFFLEEEIGIDERSAFLDYNVAPPSLRRNIGIWGLLHMSLWLKLFSSSCLAVCTWLLGGRRLQ